MNSLLRPNGTGFTELFRPFLLHTQLIDSPVSNETIDLNLNMLNAFQYLLPLISTALLYYRAEWAYNGIEPDSLHCVL